MMKREQGFTMVELMVAVTLGLMVIAGVAAVLVSSSTIFRGADSRAQIQSGSRFALALMEEDVRMAGHMGCFNPHLYRSRMRNLAKLPIAFNDNYAQSITGFDAGTTDWTPALISSIGAAGSHAPVAGTDVLVVRTPVGLSLPLKEPMNNTAEPIPLARVDKLEDGGLAVISDCSYADIFRMTNVPADKKILHAASLNEDAQLSKAYSNLRNATLTPVATISYFIAQSSTSTSARSLWRQVNSDTAEEVVEGVHDLQVEYGVDTDVAKDMAPNQFLTARALPANAVITAVRVSLLLRSQSANGTTIRSTYRFNGVNKTAAAGDHHVYTPFTTTINVRNQVN